MKYRQVIVKLAATFFPVYFGTFTLMNTSLHLNRVMSLEFVRQNPKLVSNIQAV